MKRTKIVCTLGPASLHPETIAAMIRAGMDVARLNESHGSPESHGEAIALVRRVADECNKPVGILMDLSGPKIRTGETEYSRALELVPGRELRLTTEEGPGTEHLLTVEYPRLTEDVLAGEWEGYGSCPRRQQWQPPVARRRPDLPELARGKFQPEG